MNYKYNIEIMNTRKNEGFSEGLIDGLKWFAVVKETESSFGINPRTLFKGRGKVIRLCVYEDDQKVEGNPYLPSMSIRRLIYANFDKDWKVLNHKYKDMIQELVIYLDRRYTMHALK